VKKPEMKMAYQFWQYLCSMEIISRVSTRSAMLCTTWYEVTKSYSFKTWFSMLMQWCQSSYTLVVRVFLIP